MKKNIFLIGLCLLILETYTKNNTLNVKDRERVRLASPKKYPTKQKIVKVQGGSKVWLAPPKNHSNNNGNKIKIQGGGSLCYPKSSEGRVWLAPPKKYPTKQGVVKVQGGSKVWLAQPKQYRQKSSKVWFTYKENQDGNKVEVQAKYVKTSKNIWEGRERKRLGQKEEIIEEESQEIIEETLLKENTNNKDAF
jgi:hypothetical protein